MPNIEKVPRHLLHRVMSIRLLAFNALISADIMLCFLITGIAISNEVFISPAPKIITITVVVIFTVAIAVITRPSHLILLLLLY
tara:strand:- start:124 stop:375 length:252 start_codon:yes stop_codon:yes gene_type:complete